MSENPEAFDALRKAAYAYVNANGKDAEALRRFCTDFMRRRHDAGSPSEMNGVSSKGLIDDVVRWTMNRYNRPRYKPQRNREDRAAAFLIAPEAFTMSGELYGKATVRNTARVTGQSKSTVARHLLRQGIAPRRTANIRKLPKTTQQLVAILDATFDRRAAGILEMDRLCSVLWDGQTPRIVPMTTQASRRKKLKTLLGEISSAGVGYSIIVIGDLCGVYRGRRFRSLPEASTWVAEEKRLRRYVPIQLPCPCVERTKGYFWSDPIVVDMMSLIEMGVSGHFYPPEKLEAIFRFERLLIDTTPILPWVERAYHSFAGDNMAENLSDLAGMITDPVVKKAARRLAKVMLELKGFMGSFPLCCDAFETVNFVLGVMDKVAETSPESFAKLAYIRDWFESSGMYYEDTREQLSQMLELEKAGQWQAPDAETLSRYLPVIDTAHMD
ncbi:hypothetical protein GOB36_11650 [Sinorhizobium meliloti]|uniref:hypothetical protein n=1 Tax=Rhizobium meliloti TaxID=382 RepID=UPI00299CEE5A|nr:hypothetical protein [Sinorhizobium meliloti]MDX0032272.1 hypothetical protein [Sinorhizobium meliloti]